MTVYPRLLLINPWICDFAAYDLWSRPLGLLYLAAWLRRAGYTVDWLDCLAPPPPPADAPAAATPRRRRFGTGPFQREVIAKPLPLRDVTRHFARYGLPPAALEAELRRRPRPAAVLVTSHMTYWYPGVQAVIRLVRAVFPGVPVLLGGIYAQLCPEHAARHAGADRVTSAKDPQTVALELAHLGLPALATPAAEPLEIWPAWDLDPQPHYICLLTSLGCPLRCRYCASRRLQPRHIARDPLEVFEELRYWVQTLQIRDVAFYDDALLNHAPERLAVLLEKVVAAGLKVRFHTPNAVHLRDITADLARLLKRAGFHTLRLGLESTDPELHRRLGVKFAPGDFERAVTHLKQAGFTPSEIGVYVLAGLPDQSPASVAESLERIASTGASPHLAEYSPIPGTDLWPRALEVSPYPLASEPLWHNNSLLPCWPEPHRMAYLQLKQLTLDIRRRPD